MFDPSCVTCRAYENANAYADVMGRQHEEQDRAFKKDREKNQQQVASRQRQAQAAARPPSPFAGLGILLAVVVGIPLLIVLMVAMAAFAVLLAVVQGLVFLIPVAGLAAGFYLRRRRSQGCSWERWDRVGLGAVVAALVWVVAVVFAVNWTLLGVLLIIGAVAAGWFTYRLDPARIEGFWPHDVLLPTVVQGWVDAVKVRAAARQARSATGVQDVTASVVDDVDVTPPPVADPPAPTV